MIPLLLVPCLGLILPPQDLPRRFLQADYNSRDLSQAANYFISMGEEKAFEKLSSLASFNGAERRWALAAASPKVTSFSLNSRLSWMCRILYEPRGAEPLRPPRFGALSLPAMPLEKWPLYPLVLSGDTYFVLGDGYNLAGLAESLTAYMDYCRTVGVFRKKTLPLPDRKQALRDCALLTTSENWKALKWTDASYSIPEEDVTNRIKSQAERIPEK